MISGDEVLEICDSSGNQRNTFLFFGTSRGTTSERTAARTRTARVPARQRSQRFLSTLPKAAKLALLLQASGVRVRLLLFVVRVDNTVIFFFRTARKGAGTSFKQSYRV